MNDLISRQAAIEMLMNQNVIMDGSEYHNGFNAGVNRAQEVIRNLPPVQPKTNCPEIPDSCNAETVEAIPVDWIRNYISNLKDMGVQLSLRDAQAVSVMVDKYMMEQNGNAVCGPDYCDINFGGGTKA